MPTQKGMMTVTLDGLDAEFISQMTLQIDCTHLQANEEGVRVRCTCTCLGTDNEEDISHFSIFSVFLPLSLSHSYHITLSLHLLKQLE